MKITKKFLRHAQIYLDIAKNISKFSKANRQKVGAVLVSHEGKIIGTGYNGTPVGVDNSCEHETENGLVTIDYVIHAELNAILNATTSNLADSTLYVTLSPCITCASNIIQKKITAVVYSENYRDLSGIKFLRQHNIQVMHMANSAIND